MLKPSIPQGTRDFSPPEVRKRQYILNTLKGIFEEYGFQPLETPAMENLTTLTGKYGDEGDRLIFKILNNGLHEKKDKDKEQLVKEWHTMLDKPYLSPKITERALRYDLTIPFARFVVMRQNDIAFPFRRYQMQPVWRADRPQKGRYREFWQCDADVVGSTSLINEAELLCIYRQAFHEMKLPEVTVKVNSRKLLAGIAAYGGEYNRMVDIVTALDKLDKVGWYGVVNELETKGITQHCINKLEEVINISGSNEEKLIILERIFSNANNDTIVFGKNDKEWTIKEIGLEGIQELRQTLSYHKALQNDAWSSQLVVDISLARGLNYYTGVIVEVTTDAVKMGSIGGGGRYDDLTGLFGLKNMSGVGVSFGIDRIYDVLEELNLFPEELATGTKVLIINFGGEDEAYCLGVLGKLRSEGIAAEIYPDAAKFDKQMKYANKRNLPYVILAGEEERTKQMVSLKDFHSGEQKMMAVDEAVQKLK